MMDATGSDVSQVLGTYLGFVHASYFSSLNSVLHCVILVSGFLCHSCDCSYISEVHIIVSYFFL